MTKNQIEFNKLRENIRSNRENESLTRKRDEAARALGINTLAEQSRHNRAGESISLDTLAETSRSNLARERETARSNLEKEKETHRSNVAKEAETERHQKASEAIDIGRAATAVGEAAERVRHNLVMESKDLSPKVINTQTTTTPSPTATQPIVVEVKPDYASPSTSTQLKIPKQDDAGFTRGFGVDKKGPYQSYRDEKGVWHKIRDGGDGYWYFDEEE